MPDALERLVVLAWFQSNLSRAEKHLQVKACQVISGNLLAACLKSLYGGSRPTGAYSRRRYASSEIGAILRADFGSKVVAIYRGGAADAQAVRRQPSKLCPQLHSGIIHECVSPCSIVEALAMDLNSQHVVLVLSALAAAIDQLQSLGYALYLETKAPSWTQPRSISVSGEGFQIGSDQQMRRFDRALTLGCAIQRDATRERSLIFSVLFAWNATQWFIQSSVEDEDLTRDTITEVLWESPEYHATTVGTAIEGLQQALTALTASVTHERITACIATIERRQ